MFGTFKVGIYRNTVFLQILSEFISGGSLAGVLHSKMPLPMEQVRYYTAQLVNVLNYLHEKAVVHKNLRVSVKHVVYRKRWFIVLWGNCLVTLNLIYC